MRRTSEMRSEASIELREERLERVVEVRVAVAMAAILFAFHSMRAGVKWLSHLVCVAFCSSISLPRHGGQARLREAD